MFRMYANCICVIIFDLLKQAKYNVHSWSQGPSQAFVGQVGSNRPGAGAAAGRRNYSLNLERIWANQRRADQLSRLLGKALLRRGHFKVD